jgi:predicted methyltransferase MtxX (methanogen marker protein 4)
MFYAIFYPLLVLLQRDKQADYILHTGQFVLKMASERNVKHSGIKQQEHAFKEYIVNI